MTWIKTIDPENASGLLKEIFDRISPGSKPDNIVLAHSLRPHTLEGHLHLYRSVLHHPGNTLPRWFLETIGVYVSLLNRCDYCVDHHFAGLSRLLEDDNRTTLIYNCLKNNNPEAFFNESQLLLIRYAGKLAASPETISQSDMQILRQAGIEDGEILEVNQVTSYFCYANRVVLGLGVDTKGDILGNSPD